MALIYESMNFTVDAVDLPLVDRNDGGHVTINPIVKVADRQGLSPMQAIELMRLTMVVGEAMSTAMNKAAVDIGRINYQDNGNWSVFNPEGAFLHIHLYGRAKSARIQLYGQACYFPHRDIEPEFYAGNQPLTAEDVAMICAEIIFILSKDIYQDKNWFPVD